MVLKAAAGTRRKYLLGLKAPKDILTKLEEVNGGSSKGTVSSLQRQFTSTYLNNKVNDVAPVLSHLQAQIGGVLFEDKSTDLRFHIMDTMFIRLPD